TLRAACTGLQARSQQLGNLWVTVRDHDDTSKLPNAELAVVINVVDGKNPHFADTIQTTGTVLGVSAGATTAEQLARVPACVAADGSQIDGILVADPDPADHTTGRLPQLARPAQRTRPPQRARPAQWTRPPQRTRPAHITTRATET